MVLTVIIHTLVIEVPQVLQVLQAPDFQANQVLLDLLDLLRTNIMALTMAGIELS